MTGKLEEYYHPNKQWLQWLAIALLAFYQLTAGIIPAWDMQSDFPNYYTSSRLLAEGKDVSDIYHNDWFAQQMADFSISMPGKFTPFPPPSALILLPLAPLDPLTAKRTWLAVNILLLIPLLRIMKRTTGFCDRENLLLVLLCGLGLATNFLLGQMYLLILFALFYGYDWILRRKDLPGGFIWGLAAAVKYLPAIFLIPFFILKNRSAVAGLLAGFLLLHLISFLWMGNGVYSDYAGILFNHVNGTIEGQSPFAYQFQSWNALLRKLFVSDASENPNPLIASVALFEIFRMLIYGAVTAVAIKTIFDLRKSSRFAEISVAVIGISVFEILPASATYHFLLLLFPAALLLKNLPEKRDGWYAGCILILFASINCLPVILQKIIPPDSVLIYYRLYLMTLFYLTAIWMVRRKIADGSFVRPHS